MRVRFGVAMAPKGGKTAIVGVEVRERRGPDGRLVHDFEVGALEWISPGTIEAASSRVLELLTLAKDVRPCAIIDVGSPQGLALHQHLRNRQPEGLHRPHAYPGTGSRAPLFGAFLQAYADGRVHFAAGLPNRADLDRALVFYTGGGVSKHGVELKSEEEALVIALGLSITWPRHGAGARPPAPVV